MSDALSRLNAALEGRYRIERELGSGGMGTVYLAEDLKHRRNVAIKVLHPELGSLVGGVRFHREIQIVARIEHPHILTLIDSGDADGLLYFVMPFVKGQSLRARLAKEGPLPIAEVVRLMRDVADGLAEAHRQGLVHRDIKPDNVMMSGNHAVLMDFGVAKAMSTETSPHEVTTTGIALGTPAYMSPEQAAADPGIDHRTDIYALGVLAYELLTGRQPFSGNTYAQVLAAHLNSTPDPISQHRPETPPGLEALVMKCLARDPDDRWQHTEDLVRQLEALATPSGGVPSMRIPAVKAARGGNRSLTRILAAAAVVVVALSLGVVWQRSSAATAALVADVQAAVDAGDLDRVHTILALAGRGLDERPFASIAEAVGGTSVIVTDPPGAAVHLRRASATSDSLGPGLDVGPTPARVALVAGEYRGTLSAAGYEAADFLVHVRVGDSLSLRRTLVPEAWDVRHMVYVEGGPVPGPLSDRFQGIDVEPFLMDRFEVTNQRFMAFISAGGYRSPVLWPDSMYVDGVWLPGDEALSRFVDRTGLPGPRGWSGGTMPEDRADHPVTGVSWYEASAFAAWSGTALPTLQQWWRGALGDSGSRFPWGDELQSIDDRSNFGGAGTTPVAQFRSGAGPWGAFDMAGNVKEWTFAEPGDTLNAVLGGSWQSPTYMFDWQNLETLQVWFGSEEVGFRLVRPVPNL
ncbi:MAG TPA: bifunctional serine/threonine-protein kinase/formylglycine-generating enzyme family protein [Longimicrobiales bacterium]|nr:bifunctional serine/threonine-protein kinase/formylglycine-generating enzyme family protein [Longimicrobiales bacterium]